MSFPEQDQPATPEVQASPVEGWLLTNETPPAWEAFFDAETVRAWATEVAIAVATREASEWELAGHAVVVQHAEEEEAASLLHRAALSAGLAFARVPVESVDALLLDPSTPFLHHAPILVMLELGPWAVEGPRPDGEALEGSATSRLSAVRKKIAQFDIMRPVLFAVCCEHDHEIGDDLKRVGAFDRWMVIQEPDAEFVGRRFLADLGEGVAAPSLSTAPAKVGRMLASEFERRHQQLSAALQLRRLARRKARSVEFNDLADLAMRGLQEVSPKARTSVNDQIRRKTACHEAGHACIAVISSGGCNVPDYASIVPAKDFEGIVLQSLAYHDAQQEFTFETLLLQVRIALAGRAAEELFFGPLQVSSGANSDLAMATRQCFRMFAYSGFDPSTGRDGSTGSNLAVLHRGEVDAVQNQRIRREVRRFLAEQYDHVLKTLREHQPFVEAVAERLLWDPVIDQTEMALLAQQHGF
jgi:hypothetical protein